MDRKQGMCSVVTTLLVFTLFSILPIDGQVICPWCDKSMQPRLLDCMYSGMISSPELMMIPLPDIEDVKWQVASYSDSLTYMPYNAKKVAVDKKFCSVIADVIGRNNYQNNHAIINALSGLAGNCYSLVTGYDPSIVTRDVKAMVKENIDKKNNAPPLVENPNPDPFPANQQNGFQSPLPPVQPPLNAPGSSPMNSFNYPPFSNNGPYNPPGSSPLNSFNNPPSTNNGPYIPPGSSPVNSFNNPPSANNGPYFPPRSSPVKSFNNPPSGNNGPYIPPGSSPVNSFNNPPSGNNVPFNPPRQSPMNSFGNPPSGNNGPFNPPGSSPVNSFNNPPAGNNAPFNPPEQSSMKSSDYPSFGSDDYLSPPLNPSSTPSSGNNAAGSSENAPSNDNVGQGQETSDYSENQEPFDGSSPSLQNDKGYQDDNNSPNNAAIASTASLSISSPPQDSKLTNSDSSESSNWTTLPPKTDASQEKAVGNEKSAKDEQPCDEKFKTALFEELIHDDRFCNFFTKLPTSSTKPEVPKIIKHAFKEYGIGEQHNKEFMTYWKFESQTLNKESKAEVWDEVISKILKIIFSRNNLLKGDCEEDGKTFASYILDTFPGKPAASSTENTNQKEGDDETSTESNSNPSSQKANPSSNPPENASTESNLNSDKATDSNNLSFPELHSKLSSMFKNNGSTEDDGNVPFSELLTKFEMQDMLGKLNSAALDCMSPSGFDFDKFLPTMTNVAASIQKNHPDWSQDKCQKEMYSATIAVLTEALHKTLKDSNNNAKSQSSSTQPGSAVDTSSSQSSNSDAQPQATNDYDVSLDDSAYPSEPLSDYDSAYPSRPGTNYDSSFPLRPGTDYDSAYPAGTDYDSAYPAGTDYDSVYPAGADYDSAYPAGPDYDSAYPSGPGIDYDSDSAPQQQQEFSNYGGYADGTGPKNIPSPGNQPGPDYYNPGFSQARGQNFPPQSYPAGPPTNMNSQPYSGNQPNFAPDYSAVNTPSKNFGNSQFQAGYPNGDYGFEAGPPEVQPVVPNGNSQNFSPRFNWDNNYGAPATGQNYNTQPQSNFNSGVQPAGPNYNTQPRFNPNYYNSGVPSKGQALPIW